MLRLALLLSLSAAAATGTPADSMGDAPATGAPAGVPGDAPAAYYSSRVVSRLLPAALRNDGSHVACESECCRAVQRNFACNQSACEDLVAGYVNYLEFYYCTLPGPVEGPGTVTAARVALFAGLLVWLFFLLHLIETTVNDYFCAALTLAVDWLQLSPNVAGVAFLAVGNAAPGVIASIAAFASNSPKVGIGTTLGAGVFDACAVIGVITLVGDVRLPRRLREQRQRRVADVHGVPFQHL